MNSGLYYVTVTTGLCESVDSINVLVINNPLPVISSSASYLCEGQTAVLSTGPADSYSWNTNQASASIVIDSGGVYSLNVVTNGCSGSAVLNITEYQNPVVNLGSDTLICSSAAPFQLNAPSGYSTYQWQDGSASQYFNVNNSGTYAVAVDNGHCSASDSIQVTVNPTPAPVISAGTPYLCGNSSTTLSASVSGNYQWSNGDSATTTLVSSGGNYTLTVDLNGCIGTASYQLNQYSVPSVNLGSDTAICTGSSMILQAPAGYSYVWQDLSSGQSLNAGTSGIYWVTVSNGNCSATDSIQVIVASCLVPVANFSSSQPVICQDNCIDFYDQSLNGTYWDWTFPGALTPSSTLQNPVNICYAVPGIYYAQLVVSNANGLTDTLRRTIYVNALPPVPSISLNGTVLTSSPSSAYQWFLNSTAIPGANSQQYQCMQSGYYSVFITDADGCSAYSGSFFVNITGIKILNENSFNIVPNPSHGVFTIQFPEGSDETELQVTDLSGKKLITKVLPAATTTETMSLADFADGVYFLQVKSGSSLINKKIIIQR